jgi:tRNA-specific 2-thiouridylase
MLPDLAKEMGMEFDYFATGHYARVEWQESTHKYRLRKGIDPHKDQSYFLYRLSQDQLAHVLFPLGELTKREVRQLSSAITVPLAGKEESQDFYSGDYKDLFDIPEAPGDIVNPQGHVLGQHKGIWNYTVGQRKGLGIAWTEPLYVTGLNKEKNQVVVGIREDVLSSDFLVEDLNWIDIDNLLHPKEVKVKIRSAQKEREATVEPFENGTVRVIFHVPNDSIAPGQSAVFYQDDIVIGGGIIKSVL